MARDIKKYVKGVGVKPVAATGITEKGELEALNSSGKLNYHNGTTASPVVTESHAATLTNKTIIDPLGLDKYDVGLDNVDNTSDADKPVSTATLDALSNKASITLDNLSNPTAVNQDLLPDSGPRSLGSLTSYWAALYTPVIENASALYVRTSAGTSSSSVTLQTGDTTIANSGSVTVKSGTSNSDNTGSVAIFTGSVVAGTGSSGSILLSTGPTPVASNRGIIILDGRHTDANSTNIKNVADPIAAQDAATKAYVDTNKANRSLDNLTATSINQDLIPDTDNTKAVGSNANNWTSVNTRAVHSNNSLVIRSGDTGPSATGDVTLKSKDLPAAGNTGAVSVASGNQSTGSGSSGGVVVKSGDSVGATGAVTITTGSPSSGSSGAVSITTAVSSSSSGSITLSTGSAPTRGAISVSASEMDMNSTKITNLPTPTASNDAVNKEYVDIVAGSVGGINFLPLSAVSWNAESGTTGWSQYKDAVSTRPVDGTGGTGTVTITTSSTAPLTGDNSFIITKPASNVRGEGVSANFTIDNASKANVLKVEFDYIVNSGTFVAGSSTADSDLIVYLYDVTNSKLIEPSTFKLFSNSSTISDKFSGYFQTSPDSTSYRLIFHITTDSTSAFTLKVDSVAVGPSKYVYGTPVTDWQSYVPIVTHDSGGVTNVNFSGRFRRVGDSIELNVGAVFTGTSASFNQIFFSLPSGLAIDTSKLAVTTSGAAHLGTGKIQDVGVNVYDLMVRYINPTTMLLQASNAGGTYVTGAGITNTIPFTFNTGDSIHFEAKAPIQGWSSSVKVSDGFDGREIVTYASGNVGVALTGGVTDIPFALISSTTGSWSGTQFTAPASGNYDFKGMLGFTSNFASGGVQLFINGVHKKFVGMALAHNFERAIICASEYLRAGDVVSFRANINITLIAVADINHISISRQASQQTIAQSEVIAGRYYDTAGLTPGNGYSTRSLIRFSTKRFDTHNIYNPATGIGTVPVAGMYKITAQAMLDRTSGSVGDSYGIVIEVNNVPVSEARSRAMFTGTCQGEPQASLLVDLKAGDTFRAVTYVVGISGRVNPSNILLNFIEFNKVG